MHGKKVSAGKTYATLLNPIAYRGPSGGFLYKGLHSETNEPEALVELCGARMKSNVNLLGRVLTPTPGRGVSGDCGGRKGVPKLSDTKPVRLIKREC